MGEILIAGLASLLISIFLGPKFIQFLRDREFGQHIREEGPAEHHLKAGTPTMGGLVIFTAIGIPYLILSNRDAASLAVFGTALASAGIGFVDDWLKIVKARSLGLSARTKLFLQLLIAIGLWLVATKVVGLSDELSFRIFDGQVDIGGFYVVLIFLVIAGATNGVNLADGLDGLAAGCTCSAAFTYGVLAYIAGNFKIAKYLDIPFNPFAGELAIICMAMVGASFGFLWFNCHPAKVFMGDTGSLAIGGMLGVVAICTKQELLLVVVGGVFVIEAVSVLIQRVWFKITKRRYGEGRRVFLMSPIHHHFELKGWKENTVIVRFWVLSIMFALLGLATLKLR